MKARIVIVSLAAVFWMSRNAPPKKRLLTSELHSFLRIGWFIRLLLLSTPSFPLIACNGVISGVATKGKRSDPCDSDSITLIHQSDFWFHKVLTTLASPLQIHWKFSLINLPFRTSTMSKVLNQISKYLTRITCRGDPGCFGFSTCNSRHSKSQPTQKSIFNR